MTYRQLARLGALSASITISIVGCARQAKEPAVEETPPAERFSQLAQQDAPATQPSVHTDLNLSPSDTTDVLAMKTASYAAELERLIAERAAEAAAAQAKAVASQGAAASPTTKPMAAAAPVKSDVAWLDPKPLPPPGAPETARAVAQTPEAEKKPTIHQLLDTAPATANQAIAIPADGARVATIKTTPVFEVKPLPAAPPRAPVEPLASDVLATRLAQRIKEDPLDVAAHLDYQLLQLINDQSVPELNRIAPLPQEDREIVSAVLDGLSNFRSGLRNGGGNALLPEKAQPLVEMGERIRTQSTLTVPTLVLCRDVKQFGIYQPFASTRFPFGERHLMVAYCEVQNFVSQLNSTNLWETKLKYEVMVYTDSDASLQVWRLEPTPVVDQSHSRRRDFFIAKLLELPADLPVGGYLMKVSIVDDTANRIAEATVPLQIVAK